MISTLRPYQLQIDGMIRQSFMAGNRKIMVMAPTGAGKTKLAANLVCNAHAKGRRVAFVVPFISLIDQTLASFEAEGLRPFIDMGVIQADHPMTNYSAPILICSIDTLSRKSEFPPVDLVIIDEAHRHNKYMWSWMKAVDIPFIGLSATPWSKGLAKHYDDLVIGITTQELIDQGFLSGFLVFAPSAPDLSGVDVVAGDFHQGQLAEVSSTPELIGSIVDTWLEDGIGRPTLCYAVDCAHARKIQAEFLSRGINAGYIDAHTDLEERQAIAKQFHDGVISIVVNVGTLVAGIDWDVRCLIIAVSTKSEIKFVQIVGRGLRTAEGKDYCLILDHSDTHNRLGFVTDIHHDTLDDGKPKEKSTKSEKDEKLPKPCVKCGCLCKGACPSCGFIAQRQSEVENGKGELIEMGAKGKKDKSATPQEKQEIWGMLAHYAATKNYSKGWVYHTCREMLGSIPQRQDVPMLPPSAKVLNFIKHKMIKNSKRRSNTSKTVSA